MILCDRMTVETSTMTVVNSLIIIIMMAEIEIDLKTKKNVSTHEYEVTLCDVVVFTRCRTFRVFIWSFFLQDII